MTVFEEYIRHSEPHKREKGSARQTAICLQVVDGLKISDYLRKNEWRNGAVCVGRKPKCSRECPKV